MADAPVPHSHTPTGGHHDWNSKEYVAKWVAKDDGRPAREEILDGMMAAALFDRDEAITVLDIGGGNGRVTAAVLRAFPNAQVTMQDFSRPMLDLAKERFAANAGQMRYVLADFYDAGWIKSVGGPFDLAVSAIAIHNLTDLALIKPIYGSIRTVMKPGGCFLDCDHFHLCGGLRENMDAFRAVGFGKVELIGEERDPSIVRAIA